MDRSKVCELCQLSPTQLAVLLPGDAPEVCFNELVYASLFSNLLRVGWPPDAVYFVEHAFRHDARAAVERVERVLEDGKSSTVEGTLVIIDRRYVAFTGVAAFLDVLNAVRLDTLPTIPVETISYSVLGTALRFKELRADDARTATPAAPETP